MTDPAFRATVIGSSKDGFTLPDGILWWQGRLVLADEGVAFLPRMCVEQEIAQGALCEVKVKELHVERKIRLVYPTRRALSHAALAFLDVIAARGARSPASPPART